MYVSKVLTLVLGFIAFALLLIACVSPMWTSTDSDNGRGPWTHMTDSNTHNNGMSTCGDSFCSKERTVQAFTIMSVVFSGLGLIAMALGLGRDGTYRSSDQPAQSGGYNATKAGGYASSILFILAGIFGLIAFAVWTEMYSDDVNSRGWSWDWGYGCEIAGWILSLITGAVALS
jgi:glycerol uptake facilitator-like aquaporin